MAADGTIYFGNIGAFLPEIGIRKGRLYALHPNGQLKWSFLADGEINSTPAIAADGTIYFGADDWHVYALNPNGTLRWKYWTLGKVQNGLSIGFDGTVYATSVGLYALFENPSPLAAAPWPKFKHDLRNTGNVATTNDAPEWVFPFASNAFDQNVRAILVQGDEIYVGGDFTIAGGRMASHVAKWDGTRWSALGQGIAGSVNALAWYNGELYAGGNFSQAGGQDIPMLARWNGTSWSAVGPPINDFVASLAVHDGLLYIGGYFSQLDGQPVGSILTWDGTTLSDTGLGNSGLSRTTALASLGGSLYAGVSALGPPEDRSHGVVLRTPAGWEEVARGLNNHIYALAVYGGQLYVG
ncbi:MAG TPA: PQQ-binding-like beta-propeller repeat protein, partial [Verrucomicrobiae bacterium]|nr:PQQ-binding-like beta-propeller repeat protein [Verrucomicrobiae bacterium]